MTKTRRRGLTAVLAFALVLGAAVIAGCGDDESGGGGDSEGSDSGPVKIGFAIGQSGLLEPYDTVAKVGADFAIEDINADGGADGRDLEAVEADTKSEPAAAANAAIQLLDDGADVLVVGCDFDLGGGASAIEANNRGVLAVSTCGASTKFGPSGAGDLVFTMASAAPSDGATMADYADQQGYEHPFLIEEQTVDFEKQAVFGFEERWKALGGELAGKATMQNDDQSFASQVSDIQSSSADAVFIATYMPGAAKLLREIRGAGIDVPILGTEDFDGDYWKEGVKDVSDLCFPTYGSIYGDDPEDNINALVDRFKEQEGSPPDLALGLVTGYSAVEAIAQAVEEAGGSSNGEDLATEMESWGDEDFLVGPTTFDEELHITLSREERVMCIDNGKTSFTETLRPEDVAVPES